jgi:hypothetical protein
VGVVLLDFSAAFDIIDHNLLLRKPMYYGLSTSALNPQHGNLSNRTQRDFINGSFSNVKHVKFGVPQGSSLGPLLFSIFTTVLPQALNKACVSIYADDSTIYASATTANEVTRGLFTVPKSRTNSRKSSVLHRAIIVRNFVPSHIAQMNSKPGL